jgi:hypothetical protein
MAENDGLAAELVEDGRSGCSHYRRKCKLVVSFNCPFMFLFSDISNLKWCGCYSIDLGNTLFKYLLIVMIVMNLIL